MNDARQFAPATERNREYILKVLLKVLPKEGTILEIASGTGEHAVFFAPHLHPRIWQPSDPNPILRDSIAAWRSHSPADNLHPPLEINASQLVWPVEKNPPEVPIGAIVNINMIHISPWEACLGLMAGAGRVLPNEGILYLYGPFKRDGKHTAPSNASFDESLRLQNSQWGVRDLEAVTEVAQKEGLKLLEVIQMPANNLSVVFQRE
ncbi:MAG: DUF938 domain-containing protein [Prochloraceae cyanobacterium]